jgi:hypothetical protein
MLRGRGRRRVIDDQKCGEERTRHDERHPEGIEGLRIRRAVPHTCAGGACRIRLGGLSLCRGHARLSLIFGGATAFNQNYTVLGIGGGYFIADGIEAGLDAESWSGSSPSIEEISPQVRAVFPRPGSVSPYAGVFYRRTFTEGYRALDTVGAPVGLYFLSGGNLYFGAGVAEENHLNCDRTIYTSCAEIYPELSLALIF